MLRSDDRWAAKAARVSALAKGVSEFLVPLDLKSVRREIAGAVG